MCLDNLLPSLCLPPSKTRRAATTKAGTQQKGNRETLVQVPGVGTYLEYCWRAHEQGTQPLSAEDYFIAIVKQFSQTPAQIRCGMNFQFRFKPLKEVLQ